MTPCKLLEISDCGPYLGLSVDSIRRLVRSGQLRAFRPGGRKFLVREDDLLNFMASRSTFGNQVQDVNAGGGD